MDDGKFDVSILDSLPATFENKYIREVVLEKPLTIIVDGRNNRGIVNL